MLVIRRDTPNLTNSLLFSRIASVLMNHVAPDEERKLVEEAGLRMDVQVEAR